MSTEKPLSCGLAKRLRSALRNFRLCAADVSDKRPRRKGSSEPVDEVQDRDHRRSQHNQFAAADSVCGIDRAGVDGTAILRALKRSRAIAPDHFACQAPLLERQPERSAD